MGVIIKQMYAYFEARDKYLPEHKLQVVELAERSLKPLIEQGLPGNLSHIIFATSCPDAIAPSLGQVIIERYNGKFSDCQSIDLVQGCAGGVSAMILASQLSEQNKSNVVVIMADAAKKASSSSSDISKIFGNGSFACLISFEETGKKLIHSKSRQYKGLNEIVNIKLGHDADQIIMREKKDMENDPRKHLGLTLNNTLALRLIKNAEKFFLEFVKESVKPEVMILHQVNPGIISLLKSIFSKYNMDFVDVSELTGNCGAASTGIALNHVKKQVAGKKILLCSFGTGGVITAGLWQN